MRFQEPKAEFVEIDLISTSGVPSDCDQNTSKRSSVETCTGPDAPYNATPCTNIPVNMFGPNS